VIRRIRRPDNCVTGNMDSDMIESSGSRPLNLFITRCDTSATTEKLKRVFLRKEGPTGRLWGWRNFVCPNG